ncbi:MAG: undecaprenyl-diphosphate phosphatase [Lachnospiraceae bacterium]|nr:undecaprenyl-diphosphate phosphatase [Lachnospiraceae bacterium]
MSIIGAVLLGLLQGLTEFLPVSSSGHLAIFQNLFHIGNGVEDLFLFDILLHVGTLIAIFLAFYKDIFKMIIEGFAIIFDLIRNIFGKITGKKWRRVIRTGYRKFVILIIVSTIPTGVIGVLLKDLVKDCSSTVIIPGIFLLITACILFIADRAPEGQKTPKDASYTDALIIGTSQGIATLPGISRSGTTITMGLVCGFDKKFAVKYSFIMSVPAVLGAAVLEIKDVAESGAHFEPVYLLGMLVAAISGYFAIKVMLEVVKNKRYIFFSIYCLLAGIVAIAGSFIVK